MIFFVREARFQSSHAAMVVGGANGATDPNRTDVVFLTKKALSLSATAANGVSDGGSNPLVPVWKSSSLASEKH